MKKKKLLSVPIAINEKWCTVSSVLLNGGFYWAGPTKWVLLNGLGAQSSRVWIWREFLSLLFIGYSTCGWRSCRRWCRKCCRYPKVFVRKSNFLSKVLSLEEPRKEFHLCRVSSEQSSIRTEPYLSKAPSEPLSEASSEPHPNVVPFEARVQRVRLSTTVQSVLRKRVQKTCLKANGRAVIWAIFICLLAFVCDSRYTLFTVSRAAVTFVAISRPLRPTVAYESTSEPFTVHCAAAHPVHLPR